MSIGTLVSVKEYLAASYDPDCDYVDGQVLERNLGEYEHGKMQKKLILYFGNREAQLGIHVVPEQRVQVTSTRFRVPDVCVVAGPEPDEQIFHRPPLICIEILSKDDTMTQMQERIDDYLKFGVPHVWVIDPRLRRAWQFTLTGMQEAKDGVLRTENPGISVPLAELFD